MHERQQAERAFRPSLRFLGGLRWVDLCNRHENLSPGDDSDSRVCEWVESSWWTAARIFPSVGRRLLDVCLRDWPLSGFDRPAAVSDEPQLSVVLPIGGRDRLASFPRVLQSVLGQHGVLLEVVIVEYAEAALYESLRGPGIQYVHIPAPAGGRFNKSVCMNEGVRRARADVVLLHDADIVVPCTYAAGVCRRISSGFDAVRPIRFLFFLDERSSRDWLEHQRLPPGIEFVQQNNPGLSTAITKSAYEDIGGHDERFEGWGGEDIEFLDRLKTRKMFGGSYSPAIHLWHPPAAQKKGHGNKQLLDEALAEPLDRRINRNRERLFAGGMQ